MMYPADTPGQGNKSAWKAEHDRRAKLFAVAPALGCRDDEPNPRPVKVTVEFSVDEACALAVLVRRLRWQQLRDLAEDDSHAHRMVTGLGLVSAALVRAQIVV